MENYEQIWFEWIAKSIHHSFFCAYRDALNPHKIGEEKIINLTPSLVQTLEILGQKGPLTSYELFVAGDYHPYDVSENNLRARLRTLFEKGLVSRRAITGGADQRPTFAYHAFSLKDTLAL